MEMLERDKHSSLFLFVFFGQMNHNVFILMGSPEMLDYGGIVCQRHS